MCSTESNAELQPTCKWLFVNDLWAELRRQAALPGGRGLKSSGETGEIDAHRTCCPLTVRRYESVESWPCSDVPSSLSVGPCSPPGAEDQAASVAAGPGGMRDVERGLLPGRSLVRLVDGTRHRVGGRLASGLRVGSPARSCNPRGVAFTFP